MSPLTFGETEALLAQINGIRSHKRATFMARLKNLLRLGLLPNVSRGRGSRSVFEPIEVFIFAMAVELTQFGLAPERVVNMLAPPTIAQRMMDHFRFRPNEPVSFDPRALATMDGGNPMGFVFGSPANSQAHRRIAQINIRPLLEDIADALPDSHHQWFFDELAQTSNAAVGPVAA